MDTKFSGGPQTIYLTALEAQVPPSVASQGPPKPSSHLAASPPGLRLETLGLPSLSVPPEMVRPSVLPSLLISSTTVTPRNSSAGR